MNRLDRKELAYELRAAGVPISYVAERLQVSRGRVSQMVREFSQEVNTQPATDTGRVEDWPELPTMEDWPELPEIDWPDILEDM